MFFNKRLKVNTDMIKAIRPTSKSSLKTQCLFAAQGDVEKAEKLYDFMKKDMENLPDYDIVPPTNMQQIKQGAMDLFGWAKENQNEILTAIDFVRNLRAGKPIGGITSAPSAPIPPINQ